VTTLFRRKQAVTEVAEPEPFEAEAEAPARRNYTPSKRELGVVTPKRTGANPRRTGAPPKDKKEAAALRRRDSTERRAAMSAGEEWALLPRDRGPEKRIARDVVDSRRNVLEYVLYLLILFMLLSFFTGNNASAAGRLEVLVLPLIILIVVVDSFLLTRRVKRVVTEMLPNASTQGLTGYSVMRAMSFRRGRVPKPQVAHGDAVRPLNGPGAARPTNLPKGFGSSSK
jgi:hypothetical protein